MEERREERNRNRNREKRLIKRLMSGSPKKDCMNEDRIFSDVNAECLRTPTSDCLYRGKICARFCKGSGAARSKWLTGDIARKQFAKSWDEPVAGGNGPTRCEPQLWVEWEFRVSGGDIPYKRIIRVSTSAKSEVHLIYFICLSQNLRIIS